MKYFIIGDIHGCYFTIREMLDEHWNKKEEQLILLGDIVNKGKNTFKTLEYLIRLNKKHLKNMIILKGNNEYLFEKYYRKEMTISVKKEFEKYNLNSSDALDWMSQFPHFIEFDNIFISHAGIDIDHTDDLKQDNLDILFTTKKLRNIGKVQFLGHVIVKEVLFDKDANAWYLDTGAANGKVLTGAKVDDTGKILEFINLKVDNRDIA